MKITVFGSGYVGLVVANCLAEVGYQVICVDIDQEKINLLKQGINPLYEPGLQNLLVTNLKNKKIYFSTDVELGVKHGEFQFIAVGTPSDEDGRANTKYVRDVAKSIGKHLDKYAVIVNKSTVPIGTANHITDIIQNVLIQREMTIPFDVVSNPEFLKEGMALEDFKKPDRIILGTNSQKAENLLRQLYAPFNPHGDRLLIMDTVSAELSKYASNAMLATKISFINEIANIAEKVGADIELVRQAISLDPRIGPYFIYPGCGYGGSCFGKDIKALIHTAKELEVDCELVQAVHRVNQLQKQKLFKKIMNYYQNEIKNKIFAIWGLAFKPETDDMRDAPSIPLIQELTALGAKVQVYDPEGMQNAKALFGEDEHIIYTNTPEEALEDANALVICTEWRIFRNPDFNKIKKSLSDQVIFDGRNIYNPKFIQDIGLKYFGIGRGDSLNKLEHHDKKSASLLTEKDAKLSEDFYYSSSN